jgi:hypothetical protein
MNSGNHLPDTNFYFKECPKCGFNWKLRDDFLDDRNVKIIGYQTNFIELSAGLFFFNHSCKGTFTIRANEFSDLYHGPFFEIRSTGNEECPDYCLYKEELRRCPVKCECAYVREIIQIIRCRQEGKRNH